MDGSAPTAIMTAQTPDQRPADSAGLSDGVLTHIDTTDTEILLYISLPQLPFDEIDAAGAYVDREQGLLVVHLPISASQTYRVQAELGSREGSREGKREGNSERGEVSTSGNMQGAHPSGEGHPAGKLGAHYRPSSGEDHISKQQEIEAKTEPGDREGRRA